MERYIVHVYTLEVEDSGVDFFPCLLVHHLRPPLLKEIFPVQHCPKLKKAHK